MRPYFEEDGIVIYHGDCRLLRQATQYELRRVSDGCSTANSLALREQYRLATLNLENLIRIQGQVELLKQSKQYLYRVCVEDAASWRDTILILTESPYMAASNALAALRKLHHELPARCQTLRITTIEELLEMVAIEPTTFEESQQMVAKLINRDAFIHASPRTTPETE